ncbi:MAG: DUF177 domain-containing protein [Alphaproteobacteria bacterium]|nr:DUF177 domain-containing protein [Alphaproteobacteria bacterium]
MSPARNSAPLLDAGVRLDALPLAGRRLAVAATKEQCAAIAERLGILSVDRLEAELLARPIKGGIEVGGSLDAEVTQECVVSFEPVPERIAEKPFRLFLSGVSGEPEHNAGAEVFVDLDGADPPDYFEGPEADLSEWLIETLALALNPYPRKPGAEIDPDYRDGEDDKDSPFKALKDLKPTKP